MKKTTKIATVCFVFTLILILTMTGEIFGAADFPNKMVTLYVGFAAGGSSDTIARSLAAKAKSICGQKMQVVNKPGAGGAVAMSLLKDMKADGYSLMISSDTPVTRAPHLRELKFDPLKDFDYITRIGAFKTSFCVPADSPFKTWADVVKWAKAHPEELKYGSPPRGTTPDIAMAVLAKREGITYSFAPFQGDSKILSALLGGHIHLAGAALGAVRKYIDANQVRPLFFFEKVDAYPNVPIAKDVGIEIQAPTSVLVFGPKGIPADVQEKLKDIFAECSKSAPFQKIAASAELQEIDNQISGDELAKHVRGNYELYKGYIEEIGLAKK